MLRDPAFGYCYRPLSSNVVNAFPDIRADMLAKVQAFDRQENDVALYGVYPLSYYGQQGGGVDLSVLEAGNNFLIDDLSATIQAVPETYQGGVLVQYGSVDQGFTGADFITLASVADGQLFFWRSYPQGVKPTEMRGSDTPK